MRFSLRWLFGLVLYAAFGCALLASDNDFLHAACVLTFAVLSIVAILGAIFSRPERRAFWLGCAIVAWSFTLTDSMPANFYTPPAAIRAVLMRLSVWREDALFKLRDPAAEVFVAIGCSIAGGLLAQRFSSRATERTG